MKKRNRNMTKKQGNTAILVVLLFFMIILSVVVGMNVKNTVELRGILEESVESQLISISLAAREMIDVDAFIAYDNEGVAEDPDYQVTLAKLRQLCDSVGAEYIYALKEMDGEYVFVFDTDTEDEAIFIPYEIAEVHEEAFTGEDAADTMNVDDDYGSFNTGAVPIWKDGKVVGIISADIADEYLERSYKSAMWNSVALIGMLVFTMVIMLVAVIRLIRKIRTMQDRLEHMAHYDNVTGLPNRQYLLDFLATATKNKVPFALFFIDLDNFKRVNDNAGHDAGDELLRHIGQYLEPGVYTIVEVESVAGYDGGSMGGEIEAGNTVTIPGDSAVKVTKQITATNVSDMGRILIIKIDESDNRLEGAKFKIYKGTTLMEDAFGEVKDTETVTVKHDENKTVSAKASFVLGGVEYTVQGGSNQTVNKSTRDVTFNYVEKQYTPDTVGVNLLNANGKTSIANKVSKSVSKVEGSWSYTAPAEITYNGARYERIGGGAITHTYANGTAKDYDVFYNKITENPAKPYTITIRYEDTNGAYLTQDAVVVQPTGTTVQPTLKSELRSGGKTYRPQAGQSVTHKVSDGAKTYTVVCNEVESQAYSITVVYRNSVTAERIGSATVTVNPGSTVNITSPSTYGEYTKVAGQADQGHRYGDTLTTYTYYYSPRGVESEAVTVYFVDANTDRVLNTATAVASAGNPATIAKLQFEGFELASWKTTEDVVHEYGAAKKFYRVYYIAEGEEEPVEPPVEPVTPPVVVPEDIVEPITPPVEEEPTAPVDEEIPTPVTPIGPGENEGNEGEEETITDTETPLGPGGSTKIDPLWALALIPAIALIVFLIVVKKKRAEENK